MLYYLQTLREMYSDLELRYNTHAPNEPEFRAYMVLMKLNEGDILRSVLYDYQPVICLITDNN